MKAILIGLVSAFFYSYVIWLIARENGLNHDPVEAGLIKSIAYSAIIAFPVSLFAHAVVSLLSWRILWITPVALGIVSIVAIGLWILDSSKEGQLVNILAFIGMPISFSIPYSLIYNNKPNKSEMATPRKPSD